MAAIQVGILYSLAQRKRRVCVVTDDEGVLPLQPRDGEGYVEQSHDDYQNLGPDAAVEKASGGPPLSDTCALSDDATGLVTKCLCADPSIDAIEGHTLTLAVDARQGDRLNKGVIERRFAVVDASNKVSDVVWAEPDKAPVPPNGGRVKIDLGLQKNDTVPADVAKSAIDGEAVDAVKP